MHTTTATTATGKCPETQNPSGHMISERNLQRRPQHTAQARVPKRTHAWCSTLPCCTHTARRAFGSERGLVSQAYEQKIDNMAAPPHSVPSDGSSIADNYTNSS